MNASRTAPLRAFGLVLGLALLGGCRDAPTMPDAIQRLAAGQEWVAMSAPQELPRLETWLPYVSRGSETGRVAHARVRELERLALAARREGRLGAAAELRREAERVTLLALDRPPERRVLERALHSIDFWCDRVRAQVELETAPGLALTLAEVVAGRTAASEHLAAGDTAAAVLELASVSERIRAHTPEAVAQRVLERAQESVEAHGRLDEPAAARALHLLANARQELISGDPRRALHRALYALQILEGSEVRTVESEADSACASPGC